MKKLLMVLYFASCVQLSAADNLDTLLQKQAAAEALIEDGNNDITYGGQLAKDQDIYLAGSLAVDNSGVRAQGQQRIENGRAKVEEGTRELAEINAEIVTVKESLRTRLASANFHLWHDKTGRTIRAELEEVQADNIRILRDDGVEFTLAKDMLSAEDIAWIQDYQKEASAKTVNTPPPVATDSTTDIDLPSGEPAASAIDGESNTSSPADKAMVTTNPNPISNPLVKPSSAPDIAAAVPDEFITITDTLGRSIRVFVLDEDEHSMTGLKDNGQKFTVELDKLNQESKDMAKQSLLAKKASFEAKVDEYMSLNQKGKEDFQGFKMGMSPAEVGAIFLKNYNMPLDLAKSAIRGNFFRVNANAMDKASGGTKWSMSFGFSNDHLVLLEKWYSLDGDAVLSDLMQDFEISSSDQILKGPLNISGGSVEFILANTLDSLGLLSSKTLVTPNESALHVIAVGLIAKDYFRKLMIEKWEKAYLGLNAARKTTDFSARGSVGSAGGWYQLEYDGFTQKSPDPALDDFISCQMNQFMSFLVQDMYMPRDGKVLLDRQDTFWDYDFDFSWKSKDGYTLLIWSNGTILIGKSDTVRL